MSKPLILKMGHPLLKCQSVAVDNFNTNELDATVRLLFEAQQAYEGAGLAAPQLGINARIITFGGETGRYTQSKGTDQKVLINPELTPTSDEMIDGWEGCLSVPGLRGLVQRYRHISYRAYNQHGDIIQGKLSGFLARVLQHECDHLEGVLFPERIDNLKYFGFEEELTTEVL